MPSYPNWGGCYDYSFDFIGMSFPILNHVAKCELLTAARLKNEGVHNHASQMTVATKCSMDS